MQAEMIKKIKAYQWEIRKKTRLKGRFNYIRVINKCEDGRLVA
jgi:hypothetical protein